MHFLLFLELSIKSCVCYGFGKARGRRVSIQELVGNTGQGEWLVMPSLKILFKGRVSKYNLGVV